MKHSYKDAPIACSARRADTNYEIINALRDARCLTVYDFAVGVAIVSRRDKTTGQCFPSSDKIQLDAKCSCSSVTRAITSLGKKNILVRVSGGKLNKVSTYEFNPISSWKLDVLREKMSGGPADDLDVPTESTISDHANRPSGIEIHTQSHGDSAISLSFKARRQFYQEKADEAWMFFCSCFERYPNSVDHQAMTSFTEEYSIAASEYHMSHEQVLKAIYDLVVDDGYIDHVLCWRTLYDHLGTLSDKGRDVMANVETNSEYPMTAVEWSESAGLFKELTGFELEEIEWREKEEVVVGVASTDVVPFCWEVSDG